MKIINILILLILNGAIATEASQIDSLLSKQIKATNNVSKQIEKMSSGIYSLINVKVGKDSSVVIVSDFDKLIKRFENNTKDNLNATKQINETLKAQELSWIRSSIPHIFGGLIGAGGAILVFFCRWKKENTRIGKEKKEIIDEKNYYFKSLLKSSIDVSNEFSLDLKNFCNELNNDSSKYPLLKVAPNQHIKRMSTAIDNEVYSNAFINKYGRNNDTIKNYRKIANGIDYISAQIHQLVNMNEIIRNADNTRNRKYAEICNSIILVEYMEIGDPVFDDFIIFLNSFIDVFEKKNKAWRSENQNNFLTLKYSYENFTIPLIKKLEEEYNYNEKAKYVLKKLKAAKRIYDEICIQNKAHSEDFSEIQETLNEKIGILSEIHETLK